MPPIVPFLQVSHINGIIAFEFTASQLSIKAFRSQKRLEGVRIHSIHFQYISSRKFMFISHVNISHSHKHDQFETFIGLLASHLGFELWRPKKMKILTKKEVDVCLTLP